MGKRGGGIGLLLNGKFKASILRISKSENLLWIEIGTEVKLFIAVVYLVPKDSEGRNSETMCELQEDITLEKKRKSSSSGRL